MDKMHQILSRTVSHTPSPTVTRSSHSLSMPSMPYSEAFPFIPIKLPLFNTLSVRLGAPACSCDADTGSERQDGGGVCSVPET
jgi:hypothetical protein